MKVQFKTSFAKDLGWIKDKKLHQRVEVLIQLVESSENLNNVSGLKSSAPRVAFIEYASVSIESV